MNSSAKWLLTGLAMVMGASPGPAKTVLYNGKIETVTVALGTPTIIRFDKAVKTVTNAAAFAIGPASEESPDYTTLQVVARTASAQAFATFILVDGTLVKTKLVTGSGSGKDGGDSVYDFKTEDMAGGAGGAKGATASGEIRASDLMKAIIRGDRVMGYEVRQVQKALTTGEHGVKANLVQIYAGGDFNGYVIRLQNQSKEKSYEIDIRGLRLGEPSLAVLSQIDRRRLGTFGTDTSETTLRIVARPSSVYRDIVLPVGPAKKDKGGGA